MYQSQYPDSNIIGGVVCLVIGRDKHFFEGCSRTLGLDQFIRRGWIVLGFECFIEVTKPSIRVTTHRSVFMTAVASILSLPLWPLSLFVVRILIPARVLSDIL